MAVASSTVMNAVSPSSSSEVLQLVVAEGKLDLRQLGEVGSASSSSVAINPFDMGAVSQRLVELVNQQPLDSPSPPSFSLSSQLKYFCTKILLIIIFKS